MSGAAQITLLSYDNQATVHTSGIDFTVNWSAQLADMASRAFPGGLGLSVQGTWLDYYETKQSPNSYDPVIDWKGSLGPNLNGFNPGSYSYRLLTALSYNLPSLNVNLRWRHLPSVVTAAKGQEKAIIANNAAVSGGAAGILLSYTPSPAVDIPSYDVIDLSGSWHFNDTLSLRFGVDNVFDKDPLSSATSAGRPYDTSKTAAENAAALVALCTGKPGCVSPTSYSLANSGLGTTSGGYYDTIGRRYYLGLKAQF